MAKANLLTSSTTNFLELIGNGRIYRVPAYQRDYSWTEEQWEDLWNDLLELADQPDGTHYMGALVVEGRSDREFAVIDGQQRIATLSVLALAVIARLGRLAGSGLEPDANSARATALRSRFIGEKDPASLVEASKLSLNVPTMPSTRITSSSCGSRSTRAVCRNRIVRSGIASGISNARSGRFNRSPRMAGSSRP